MNHTPNGTLALATLLASLSVAELRELVASRRIASPDSVHDPLGLAIELLRPESVRHALQHLDRPSLSVLRDLAGGAPVAEQDRAALVELRLSGLLGSETRGEGGHDTGVDGSTTTVLPEVGRTLAELGFAVSAGSDTLPQTPPARTETPDVSHWFGSAAASVGRAAALLRALARRPARLSRRGTVTVVAQRELAEATHDVPEHTARLLTILRRARIVAARGEHSGQHSLAPTAGADAWLRLPFPARWLALADALILDLSPALRRAIELEFGPGTPEDGAIADIRRAAGPRLELRYPLLPASEREAAVEWTAAAEQLGLTVDGWSCPAVPALLAGDHGSALATAERDFPPVVSGIYLQPDLSLIVPGPLASADEAALAALAESEQVGVATTMRVSASSLTRAVRSGLAITEIRAILERLSLTGVPQPLDYLLGDIERRLGSARNPVSPRNRSADQSRSQSPDRSPSRAALAEEDPPAPSGSGFDPEELAQRVHDAANSADDAGDLTRRLELAIRHRSTVRVTASAGRTHRSEHTFTVLPVSVTGGRLRATDQAAGVERTLPISAIIAVETP